MVSSPPPTSGRLRRRLAATAAACVVFAGLAAVVPAASAGATSESVPTLPTPTPHAGHKIEFPTQQQWHAGRGNGHQIGPAGVQRASSAQLSYHGGVDGIGVTTGAPKVYLVFWGSQWGSAPPGSLPPSSGDPAGMAPRLQAMFKGLGTNSELWSGVMTQYCEGVASGATTCPANAAHVGYPTGGALAGVWVDGSSTPVNASEHALAAEAVTAAGHFGNTTAASNRNAQYFVVSAHNANPDGFATSGWCAWHDYNGDTSLTGGAAASPYGDVAFTNLPYLTDLGASCGAGYVNAGTAGTLDGVTIVGGHEYAETITDQNPSGGWWDSSGAENADKCAWVGVGGTGGAQNVALATGSFPMQATWSNADTSCRISRALASPVTVNNPGTQNTVVNTSPSLTQIVATDANSLPLTFTQTGLPTGLSMNTSGAITGVPTATGSFTVTVTATDTASATGSASFTWNVTPACAANPNVVVNGGFETGTTPWTISATRIRNSSATEPPHSGTYDAWLGGLGTTHTDTVSQSVTIPAGCSNSTLQLYLHIDSSETTTSSARDTFTIKLGTTTLATYSNLNKATGYSLKTFNVASQAGKTVTLTFTASENSSRQTSFVVDDVGLAAS